MRPAPRRWAAVAATLALALGGGACAASIGHIVIDVAAGPKNTFRSDEAFGAALDGTQAGGVAKLYTQANVRALKAAGLGPVSYRLRTELAIEAWHWSEEGAWSDAARQQGYWVSSDNPAMPVLTTWGYSLPRRGDSGDQANNHGYSRLDDGDAATFWKSNPYLDARFTGEARARDQWVVVQFPGDVGIDAARIAWATPFARRYQVQYWVGADEYDDEGRWITFPGGRVVDSRGGEASLRLAPKPIKATFLRILLVQSSGSGSPGAVDPRDAVGFAIAEVGFGVIDMRGSFVDAVRHAANGRNQTQIRVSSTDPWHRAVDRDADLEQPGFDRVFASGLTRGLPMLTPVGVLYDNPDNAAAEVRFLKRRGYLAPRIELGEEPDGQHVAPEDFADLYVEFADAVRRADPALVLGGPSLQSAIADTSLDTDPDHSWTRRFIARLTARGRLADLGFFSFERYPFDDLCGPLDRKLRAQTSMFEAAMARLADDRVPTTIPWIITEYGFSAFPGRAEVEMPGALLNADLAAGFIARGGAAAYLFGYGPGRPYSQGRACAGYGDLMLWEAAEDGQARWPMPAFFGAQMLAGDWAQTGGGQNTAYSTVSNLADARGGPVVKAYGLKRPDGMWSILLINRDAHSGHRIDISLRTSQGGAPVRLPGPFDVVQYGPAQFSWRAAGDAGQPMRDLPPRRFRIVGSVVDLPPYSLTVVKLPATALAH